MGLRRAISEPGERGGAAALAVVDHNPPLWAGGRDGDGRPDGLVAGFDGPAGGRRGDSGGLPATPRARGRRLGRFGGWLSHRLSCAGGGGRFRTRRPVGRASRTRRSGCGWRQPGAGTGPRYQDLGMQNPYVVSNSLQWAPMCMWGVLRTTASGSEAFRGQAAPADREFTDPSCRQNGSIGGL